jgi:hypothetical protein
MDPHEVAVRSIVLVVLDVFRYGDGDLRKLVDDVRLGRGDVTSDVSAPGGQAVPMSKNTHADSMSAMSALALSSSARGSRLTRHWTLADSLINRCPTLLVNQHC